LQKYFLLALSRAGFRAAVGRGWLINPSASRRPGRPLKDSVRPTGSEMAAGLLSPLVPLASPVLVRAEL